LIAGKVKAVNFLFDEATKVLEIDQKTKKAFLKRLLLYATLVQIPDVRKLYKCINWILDTLGAFTLTLEDYQEEWISNVLKSSETFRAIGGTLDLWKDPAEKNDLILKMQMMRSLVYEGSPIELVKKLYYNMGKIAQNGL
jgi:hypothetical protein